MGQLGVFYEAKLKIRELMSHGELTYPMGLEGTIENTHFEWPRTIWYTLFAPHDKARDAYLFLHSISKKYQEVWTPKSNYVYPIKFFNFNPPLLYPQEISFVAVGIWGGTIGGAQFDFEKMSALELELTEYARSNHDVRRYIQSELTFEPFDFQDYFGDRIYNEFFKLKKLYDPKSIVNRGTVFREKSVL
jgi:hypothetical protein